MGNKVKKELVKEVKKLPKLAWVAAVIIPGGFMMLGCYLTAKTLYSKGKNDRSKNRS